jgi:hypothetical protein
MNTGSTTLAKCFATGCLLFGTLSALAQQPTIITTTAGGGMAPNGVGVTTNELLFSQPYCDGVQPRGVYQAVQPFGGASPVLTATMTERFSLPAQSFTTCGNAAQQSAENYFAISPGLGGFPVNSVYATSPNSATTDAVLKDGAPFISSIADSAPGHAGITFDSVGTFGNALIVTTPTAIYGFNSAGTQIFNYTTALLSSTEFESASVAPNSNSACPGCLYITGDLPNGPGAIYVIHPGAPNGTVPTLIATLPGTAPSEPEGIQFITPAVCSLNGTNYSYFVSGYSTVIDDGHSTSGALLAYTQAQIQVQRLPARL